jgi:hypothetical protein
MHGAVASSAVALGLLAGLGSATAHADVLDDIDAHYDTGSGGGQVSNLVHQSIKLRAMGFRPSSTNYKALQDSLNHLPNQGPLVDALRTTVMHQHTMQVQSQAPQNPITVGVGPDPNHPDQNGIGIGGGQTINQPIG